MAMSTKKKSKIEVAFIYLFLLIMFIIIGYPLFWALMMRCESWVEYACNRIIPK